MAQVFILGAGGFGTALAVYCHQNGHQVTVWSHRADEVEQIERDHENKRLLPGIPLDMGIRFTADLSAVSGADIALIATPSSAIREVSQKLAVHLGPQTVVVCVSKGLEAGSYKRMSEVMAEELPRNRRVVLSGPSHAEELARSIPTTVVAASHDRASAEYVQEILSGPTLRIYVNDDVVGVELGGALKNIIALAAGTLDGLGMGDNTKAALMTRGLTEIARLGIACGAKSETFAGLSGMGDLIVTCTSMHSRNRRAGILIGKGIAPQDAVDQIGMTVEGYTAARTAYEMSQRLGVEMPITTEVHRVLYEGKDPQTAIRDLMGRPKRHESEVIWLLTR